MACGHCDHKGYVEIKMLKDSDTKTMARPCPKCNDTKAYYRYIKEKYGGKTPPSKITEGEVISLKDRRK